MVVMTVPAKKKEELTSHRLVWLKEFPEGFTPALTAETTCCREEGEEAELEPQILRAPSSGVPRQGGGKPTVSAHHSYTP